MLLKLKKKKIILDKDATTYWICLMLKQINDALKRHNGKRLRYHQNVLEGMFVLLGDDFVPMRMELEKISCDDINTMDCIANIYHRVESLFGELPIEFDEVIKGTELKHECYNTYYQ